MRRMIAATGLALLSSSSVLAALPPQYQRQAELLAIIGDARVVEVFGHGIEGIELNGMDHYIVRGGDCMLDVTIRDQRRPHEAGWVGPREFTLVLGEPACEGDE